MTNATSTIRIDGDRVVGRINRRMFGGFVEHMGRGVYGGVYDPAHPSADEDGFRTDVIELVKELGMTVIRYPGGNFVSGFRWEDGVGPRESRPRRLNLPWHSVETNEFGLHEFVRWVEKVDGEVMLAMNLGTRGILEAVDLLEYCNVPSGTLQSERRRANGADQPFGIKIWCLGNEADGPWQIGQMTAEEYGRLASRTARALRRVQPEIELVACGSSGYWMPTFGEWERTVLRESYEHVDFISCHAYYEPKDGDIASYLASGANMETYISELLGHADAIRDELGSDKTMQVSFDEWNVWYHSHMAPLLPKGIENWPKAPAITEDDYHVADAVVVGDMLITLLNHADRITTACMAQVVNVIAPIHAPSDGPARRKTTFYPFSLSSRYARGETLTATVASPKIQTNLHGEVDAIHSAAVRDDSGNLVVFVANRSLTDDVATTIDVSSLGGATRLIEATSISHPDWTTANTESDPDRVTPQPNATAVVSDGKVQVGLPAVSWTMLRFEVAR